MIALLDYGAGNLASVRKALAAAGAEVFTPSSPGELAGATAIVVPGVGHFQATASLDGEWRAAVRRAIDADTPLLGICLGMQWLFEGSDEAPDVPGLGVFAGRIARLPERDEDVSRLKVPHVGWNVARSAGLAAAFHGVEDGSTYYFTHTYAAPVTGDTAMVTVYGRPFASAARLGRVWGVQFHPEKSGTAGLALLRAFVGFLGSGRITPEELWRSPDSTSKRRAQAAISESSLSAVPAGNSTRPLMTFAKRLIACLDIRDGRVVKGVNFEGLRDAGDPAELAARYDAEGIDELVVLDVTATIEGRLAMARTISAIASRIFIPLAVCGGIRSVDDAARVIDAGADKVGVNTAALADPELIARVTGRFGSQAVVVAVDAKRAGGGYEVCSHSGRTPTGRDAVAWAREAEARGAGEILLTSIDADGTQRGFDCELTAAVSDAVAIPVIASGGAGAPEHFREVFSVGRADAALATSIFHDRACSVRAIKRHLRGRGLPVRLEPAC